MRELFLGSPSGRETLLTLEDVIDRLDRLETLLADKAYPDSAKRKLPPMVS